MPVRNFNLRIYLLLTVPAVLLYTLFYVFLALSGFYYSITDWDGLSRTFKIIGLRNYMRVLADERSLNSLTFNLKYSAMLLVLVFAAATFLALLLNSKIRFNRTFRAIFFFPAVLSFITVGLIWGQIFYHSLPELGRMLAIPVLSESLLSDPNTAIFGIVLVNAWQGVAIPTVLLLAGLQTIPAELYESAIIDGAGESTKFLNITVPYLIPIYNLIFILALRDGLTVFDYIIAMTDGGPGKATESVGLLIFNHAFNEMKFSYAVAEAVLLFLLFSVSSLVQIALSSKKKVVA